MGCGFSLTGLAANSIKNFLFLILSPFSFPPNTEKIRVKIIEKHIGRHENGNLYFVARKNGKLTVKSLRTSNLTEARRKISEMGTLALTATREPAVPLLVHSEPKEMDVKPSVPAIKLSEALEKHRKSLVLLTDGTRDMASLGIRVILKHGKDWSGFDPVAIWNDYRESGTKRKGRRKGKLTSAANHLRWYLRKFVPWAVSQGFLPQESVVKMKTIPCLKINSKKIRVPASSVVDEFLTMIESEDPEGGSYLRFLAVTGLRKTGALTLRWQDIDFEAGTMAVLQKGGIRKVIPMTPEAILALQGRKGRDQPYTLDANAMNRLKSRMKRFAKGFDLDLTTNHSFRHYFASRCLIAGLTVQEVAKLLGHADQGQLVLKTYGHLCGEHLKDLVSKLKLAS